MLSSQLRTEFFALIRLAAPISLASLGQSAMGLVDTAVLGRTTPISQGAAGLGNAVFFSIVVIGIGIMQGLDPLISQSVGAGDIARAKHLYRKGRHLALYISGVLAALIAVAVLALQWLRIDPQIVEQAKIYTWLRLPAVPMILMYMGTRCYVQAIGETSILVSSTIAANIMNLVLNIILVFGFGPIPALGIAGSAIATTLANAIQLTMLLLRANRLAGTAPIPSSHTEHVATARNAIRQALTVGLPIGLQMTAEVGAFALAGILAGGINPQSLAAHQIAITFASQSFCLALGVGAAGAVRVGQAVGAQDQPQIRRAGTVAFIAGTLVMGVAAIVFLLFADKLSALMTNDATVVPLAVNLLMLAALFQLADGIQAVGAAALRGIGQTRAAFIMNLIGYYALGYPIAYILTYRLNYGVVGLWWGLTIGLFFVSVTLTWRFFTSTRHAIARL